MRQRFLARSVLLLALPVICAEIAYWLPEHARGGDAAYNETRGWQKSCWREERASGTPGDGCDPGGVPTWGDIEQLCDHFTQATLTPDKQHMQRDMVQKGDARLERKAEGHANAYACRFKQRFAVDTSAWNMPIGPVILYVNGPHPLEGTPGIHARPAVPLAGRASRCMRRAPVSALLTRPAMPRRARARDGTASRGDGSRC